MKALINELQQQRKLTTPTHQDEDKIAQARFLLVESNRQMVNHFLMSKTKQNNFY